MNFKKINLVVVGHKDHGKSTLIGRLLYDSNAIPEQKLQEVEAELKKAGDEGFRFAFLLDSLEEERRGGLTIDIVQTPFKSKKYLYTIIDCPGHREFIKKMFTGASQADAAVLVASAKEGIQDQTKQHTFLIKMLGIQKLIVAVNKMDQANFEEAKFKEICMKLQPILDSLNYKNSPIVPISALKGENVLKKSERMGWYKGLSLIETLDDNVSSSTHPVDKPLRASVQDVYDPEGRRIIVCKILTGVMEKNKMISFDPSGVTDTIQKIDMLGKEVERAEAGDSVGIVVGNLAPVERGEVISYPQKRAKVPKSFVAEIILFSDVKVKNNEVLTIRCGTAQRKCKVEKILDRIDPVNLVVDAELPETLGNGDVGRIVLSPVEPLCVETYSEFPELGRFVVEGGKGTEAAGIIIETHSAAF